MIKVHLKYWILILSLFIFVKGFSQENDNEFSGNATSFNKDSLNAETPFTVKVTFHRGAILPHRKEVSEIIEGATHAYEVSFYKKTIGKKSWEQLYNYPKVGMSALAINLGNPQELGMGYGIFPFIELPISQRKIKWNFKIGYGLGYIEKPFDRVDNFKNIAIGSHLNALIYANTDWSVNLSENLSTSLGLSIIHFSNGSFSRPNLGINIASLNVGVAYDFGIHKEITSKNIEKIPHKWTKKVMFGLGLKEIPPAEGKKYVVSSYSFNLIKTRTQKSSYGFGTDVFYNTSLTDLLARDSTGTSNGLNNVRVGLSAMYSFDFGKVSVLVGVGGYVLSNYKGNGVIYNRLETRYYLNDKLCLRLAMKTHIAVADFIEFGVGYNIK